MSSVDAIFLMDGEDIDTINTDTKIKKSKIKNKKINEESNIVIAKSLPIDIIKPNINNNLIEYFLKFGVE